MTPETPESSGDDVLPLLSPEDRIRIVEQVVASLEVPRTLVEQVDFVSGATPLPGPRRRLLTNLGVFDFTTAGWRAASLHPGVGADDVAEQTGFAIDCSTAATTLDLTQEELGALDAADPDNLRALEAEPDLEEIGRLIAAEREAWERG